MYNICSEYYETVTRPIEVKKIDLVSYENTEEIPFKNRSFAVLLGS